MFLNIQKRVQEKNGKFFELFFKLSMLWRIVYGSMKLFTGILLIKIPPEALTNLFYKIASNELTEDPKDIFLGIASHNIDKLTASTILFIAFYLIFWGLIDIVISYNLINKKMWAYPTALVLMSIFTAYELIRFFFTHSIILFTIIIIDIFIIFIVYKEYKILKKESPATIS